MILISAYDDDDDYDDVDDDDDVTDIDEDLGTCGKTSS